MKFPNADSFRSFIPGIFLLWFGFICLFGGAGSAAAARFNTVVIDPGHGGRDRGAVWGGVRESNLNLAVAQDLEALLKKRGIRTVMTRRSDVFVSLQRRAQIANAQRNAVLVSIHFNASTNTAVRGAETFYWGNQGRILANAIQRRLAPRLQVRNRGIHRKGYTIMMQTRHPVVLVECGFISNPNERRRCVTRWYQQTAAKAIYDGLIAYRALR